MNAVQRVIEENSVTYLAHILGVTRMSINNWGKHPEHISYNNLKALIDKSLITDEEYDEIAKTRNGYLASIKGSRGAHNAKIVVPVEPIKIVELQTTYG